jgi:hypothetical protein
MNEFDTLQRPKAIPVMDAYEKIENLMAAKHGASTTTRKAIGDFMLSDDHAVNVKSNNVEKQNYSPNMISIKKMHEWVFEKKKDLSFIFVDYTLDGSDLKILNETDPIPIEHISWECLSIEAQGYGVIQKHRDLALITNQTKRDFYKGFLKAYDKYRRKEKKKHEKFSQRFIKDPDSIDW